MAAVVKGAGRARVVAKGTGQIRRLPPITGQDEDNPTAATEG